MNLDIIAKNKYKHTETQVLIMRNFTQKEIEEQKVRLAQQQKDEAERQATLAQREKIRASLETKYKNLFTRGLYQYEIEDKLFDMGFKQTSQWYGEAPDGSTQVITYYWKDEEGFFIVISLQAGYSSSKYWYTVEVKE